MLVIRDEQLARELEQIAERENRPVEELLKLMIAQYPSEMSATATHPKNGRAVNQVRRKLYAKARQYWQSVGDAAKASMPDEELDKQFGAFDEEGIPRLQHELESIDPPAGSLAYAAMIAERGDFRSGNPNLADESENILDAAFADDYLKRMRGGDAEG